MATRYNVDKGQAERVAATALQAFEQVADDWELGRPLSELALRWAATLHEIGLDIAHNGFQRHGAYIVANADLPGFPRSEQKLLACLIANQRTELVRSSLNSVTSKWRTSALRLAILLRLAVLLNRSRTSIEAPDFDMTVGKRELDLRFASGWLDANPLTITDLEREQRYLDEVGYSLSFS